MYNGKLRKLKIVYFQTAKPRFTFMAFFHLKHLEETLNGTTSSFMVHNYQKGLFNKAFKS